MDSKLNRCQQCTAAAVKANQTLGSICRDITSRDMITPLYLALVRPHLESCAQLWFPQFKRDMDKVDRVQRRAVKLHNVLENTPCEERLKDLGIFPLENRKLRVYIITVFQY